MARKLRVQYPGAMYHVMNRGDRSEPIFSDDTDRRRFLDTLGEACQKTGWQVHAYCLMKTHFHLVIETPQPNLVVGMKWLLGTYTNRYNTTGAARSLDIYSRAGTRLCRSTGAETATSRRRAITCI